MVIISCEIYLRKLIWVDSSSYDFELLFFLRILLTSKIIKRRHFRHIPLCTVPNMSVKSSFGLFSGLKLLAVHTYHKLSRFGKYRAWHHTCSTDSIQLGNTSNAAAREHVAYALQTLTKIRVKRSLNWQLNWLNYFRQNRFRHVLFY